MTRSSVIVADARGRAPSALDQAQGKHRYSVDLKSHMAECDANYHRLRKLVPILRKAESIKPDAQSSFALPLAGFSNDVVFTVLDRGPYTTLLEINVDGSTVWANLATGLTMTVRVYHDAQSAEVVSYQNQQRFHGKYEYPNRRMRQRDEKVQLNRFLSEFLNLCLEHGTCHQTVKF